jgi:hypothetical protein
MSLISIDFARANERLPYISGGRDEDDFAYHQRRAEEELRIAQNSDVSVVRRFHYHLAALHLDRAHAEAPMLRADEELRVA